MAVMRLEGSLYVMNLIVCQWRDYHIIVMLALAKIIIPLSDGNSMIHKLKNKPNYSIII